MIPVRLLKYGLVGCNLALILIFFHPVLFSGKTFFFRDIHRWFYPMKFFLSESFQNGHLPFWCPHYFCGAPFMSDMQSGVFYPLSFMFTCFPFPLSLNLFILFHIFLAGLFFFLFIRGSGLSQSAGWITSISYAFGGYTLSSINVLNNLSVLVWLPAVMWSFRCALVNNSRKFYLATVFFLCCAILGGEPQLFILIAGLLFLSALLPVTGRPIVSKLKACRSAVFLVVAAIGITFFQIGPTYIDYLHSVRLEGLPFKEAAQYSLPVETLQHFILPFIFPADFTTNPDSFSALFPGDGRIPWLLSIYPGFIIVPLALVGLIGKHFRDTLYWFILFCLSTFLALGDNTPFYHLFYKLAPFFRFPEKFVFIGIFSLLVMAPRIDFNALEKQVQP